jgi:hypothetical protein
VGECGPSLRDARSVSISVLCPGSWAQGDNTINNSVINIMYIVTPSRRVLSEKLTVF